MSETVSNPQIKPRIKATPAPYEIPVFSRKYEIELYSNYSMYYTTLQFNRVSIPRAVGQAVAFTTELEWIESSLSLNSITSKIARPLPRIFFFFSLLSPHCEISRFPVLTVVFFPVVSSLERPSKPQPFIPYRFLIPPKPSLTLILHLHPLDPFSPLHSHHFYFMLLGSFSTPPYTLLLQRVSHFASLLVCHESYILLCRYSFHPPTSPPPSLFIIHSARSFPYDTLSPSTSRSIYISTISLNFFSSSLFP